MVVHHECVRPPLFMGFVFKIIDYFIAKSLTSLISVSKATKETLVSNSNLLSQNSLNGHVIHNGVPINKFLRRDYLNLKIDEKIFKNWYGFKTKYRKRT